MKLVRLIGYIALGVSLACCNGKYEIAGETSLLPDGTLLFLQKLNQEHFEVIDSTIVKEGRFAFHGRQEEPAIAILVPLNDRASAIPPLLLTLQPGTIRVTLDSVSQIGGTPLNDRLQAYENQRQSFDRRMQTIARQYLNDYLSGQLTDSAFLAMKQDFEIEQKGLEKITREYITANTDNVTSVYLFLQNSFLFTPEEQRQLIANAAPAFRKHTAIRKMARMLTRLKNVAPDMSYIDLPLQTPDGHEASLSQYVGNGRYVLLDFWASWCPPCQRQTPYLKQLYDRYGNQRFSIVGISLDTNRSNWLDYVRANQMNWPQLGDPKGWDSEAILSYVIQGIPHLVLIGPDGKIVANNPSESTLDSLLSTRLKLL